MFIHSNFVRKEREKWEEGNEESGQRSNWRYIWQTCSRVGVESPVEVFSFPVAVAYLPHSSSVFKIALQSILNPPSPKGKAFGAAAPLQ